MGVANEKFGGSLSQYIADLDEKLKKDFDLEPLEKELSDTKAMKGNLVPTLTQYIQGKDKYLKFIDKMIEGMNEVNQYIEDFLMEHGLPRTPRLHAAEDDMGEFF